MAETYIEQIQTILKQVETYLEHGRNIPRARSKQTSSRGETYLEQGRNIQTASLFIPWARSKYKSNAVETYLEHGQNTLRARSKHTSSTFET